MKSLYYLLLFATLSAYLSSCSDKDEPKVEENKYAPLETVMGSTVWEVAAYQFMTPDGTVADENELLIGGVSGQTLALEENALTQYTVVGPVVKYISNYRFDRATGDIYINNNKKAEMRIVSAEPDKLSVESYYGVLDSYLEDKGLPSAINGKESYVLYEMVPADEDMKALISKPHTIIDTRK